MAYEKTQQARIEAGLCKDCGNPRGKDGTTIRCRQCASEAAKRATQRSNRVRKERYAVGLCYCGARRDNETIYCSECRKRQSQNHEKYVKPKRLKHEKDGKCKQCGKERYYESNYCRSDYIRGIASKYEVPASLHKALLQKLESTDFRCFYTGVPLIPGINACVDHLYSRSQHPDKLSDLDNLVWCDKWINRMKGHMSYEDFIALCRTIVKRADAQ